MQRPRHKPKIEKTDMEKLPVPAPGTGSDIIREENQPANGMIDNWKFPVNSIFVMVSIKIAYSCFRFIKIIWLLTGEVL
jgi:hypothetical protein